MYPILQRQDRGLLFQVRGAKCWTCVWHCQVTTTQYLYMWC